MKWSMLVLVALALTPAFASAATLPRVSVEMTQDAYAAADALGGAAPVALVTVRDAEGAPVADALVRVAIVRQTPAGYVSNETILARTGEDGMVRVTAGTVSSLPGNYLVLAIAGEHVGSDRYAVGL